MIMDFLGYPLIIILRKLRLGYYCCKDKSAETIVEDIEN